MTAYIIANITVTDPKRYPPYRAKVPAVVAQYGGVSSSAPGGGATRRSYA